MEMIKKKEFIVNFIFYGIIAAILFYCFKYIAPILIPFILAFVLALALQKPIHYIHKTFKVNKKLVSLIILILFYIVFGSVLVWISLKGYMLVLKFANAIPTIYSEIIEPTLNDLYHVLESNKIWENEELQSILQQVYGTLFNTLKNVLLTASNLTVKIVTGLVTFVPELFVSIVIMIISSFFLTFDYDSIKEYFISQFSEKGKRTIDLVQFFLKNKLFVIIKSYAMIMSLTFVELSIGLTIIGIKNSVWIALGIAIFDILPVFGTGGIMIPWGLICIVIGNLGLGLKVLLIYLIITVIRNIVEPKFVGAQLGIHPVATLALMLVGVNLFGILGLFGLPIFVSYMIFQKENKLEEDIEKVE